MGDVAVIFDVDGVLLHLTPEEENAFFWPFEKLYGLTGLSRDWDSYRIRNDADIIAEILEHHLGRPSTEAENGTIVSAYLIRWNEELQAAAKASRTRDVISMTRAPSFKRRRRMVVNSAVASACVRGMAPRTVSMSQ